MVALTIYKNLRVFGNKAGDTITVGGIIDDAVLSPSESPADAANNRSQIVATVAGAAASASPNPALALPAIATAQTALNDARTVLFNDSVDGKPKSTLIADGLTVMGDTLMVESGVLNLIGLRPMALLVDSVGDILSIGSMAAQFYPGTGAQGFIMQAGLAPPINNANDANSSASTNTIISSSLQSLLNNPTPTLATMYYNSISSAVGNFYNSTIQPGLTASANGTNDASLYASFQATFSNTQQAVTNDINNPTAANSQSLAGIQNSINQMLADADATAPPISETVADDGTVTVTPSTTSGTGTTDTSGTVADVSTGTSISYPSGDTANTSTAANGDTLVTVTPATGNGSPEVLDLSSIGGTISVDGVALVNAPTDSYISVDASGDMTVTSSSGSNANSLLATLQMAPGGGAYADLYSPTLNDAPIQKEILSADLEETVDTYDPANGGALVQQSIIDPNGYFNTSYYDDSLTDNQFMARYYYNTQGSVKSVQENTGISMADFEASTADAIADQVIAKLAFANNQTAAMAVEALGNVTIQKILGATPTNTFTGLTLNSSELFAANFAFSLASMGAGLLGSEAGSALFQDLGLPPQLGAGVGGAVTTQLASAIVADVTGSTTIEAQLTALTTSTSSLSGIADAFGSLGAGAIGSYLGTDLGDLVIGNVNVGASIGDAIGGAAGTALGALYGSTISAAVTATLGIAIPGVGVLIGATLGSFLGTVFGSLFGPGSSVGPDAAACSGYSAATNSFSMTYSNADNGGDVTVAQNLIAAEVDEQNGILKAIGGSIVGTGPQNTMGYFKGQLFYAPGYVGPNPFPNMFTDGNAAVDFAVLATMKSADIQSGDPYMEYTLATTNDTTVAQLVTDLNVAHDYEQYAASPLAFDLALSLENDPTQFQAWMTELARAEALGLTSFPFAGLSGTVLTDTAADVSANIGALQAMAADGQLTSIHLTDSGTPTLALTVGQAGGDSAALGIIAGPYHVAVRDSSSTVSENLPGLQSMVASGIVTSIALDDGGMLTLTIPVAQIMNYTQLLGMITTPYYLDAANDGTMRYLGAGAANFLGADGQDTFYQLPANLFYVSETNASGQFVAGKLLTYGDGSDFLINPASTSIIWTAQNWLGDGGEDLFLSLFGNIDVFEFNTNGQMIGADTLYYGDGSRFEVSGSVIASGRNFMGTGGNDLLFCEPDDSIAVDEFNASDHLTASENLHYSNGSGFLIATSTTEVIWVGQNLMGDGGKDIITRQPGNMINISEFNSSGTYIGGQFLYYSNGNPFLIDTGSTAVIWVGQNWMGDGGNDLITRQGGNTINISEFNSGGIYVGGRFLSYSDGSSFLLDTNTTQVIRVGSNLLGTGGQDLVTLSANNVLTTSEFNSSGQFVAGSSVATVNSGAESTSGLEISDTAADVTANFTTLETLAAAGLLSSVTLTDRMTPISSVTSTDGMTPVLALTAAQYSADGAVLGKITSAYSLSISGVAAANASTVTGQPYVTSITVSDTAANVLANITTLGSLEASGELSSVTVADNLANILANISSLQPQKSNGKVAAIIVADTTANVLANVNALKSYEFNGTLTSITLTDSGRPTISLTPSQLSADSAVLQEISSPYNLATSSGVVVLGNNQHVDIIGSNNTVIPGLNDNFGVAGTNTSILVNSEDGIFLTSSNGIADPLAAPGSNAVLGNGSGQTLSGGSGITVMVGNGGNNTFVAPGEAGGGTVTVWGGTTSAPSGSNTVDYSSYSGDLDIVLGQGEGPGGPTGWVANSDTSQYLANLNDIDNVIGGSGNNTITGNSDNDIINGGNGHDWLVGGSGNDTFVVGTGKDTINGGSGYNTYQFGSSFGQDLINNGAGTVAKGEVDFSTGITDEKLWFQQSGSDLLVTQLGTNDQIDVSGWFDGLLGNQVQTFNAGGLKLDSQIAQLVTAMATYSTGNSSFNPTTASSMPADTTLQGVIAAAWHS